MDNYNVLVLMQKDSETGLLINTVDSYKINEGMEYIDGFYLLNDSSEDYLYLTLTTEDVEDWEYYGIYDLYDESIFDDSEVEILDGSGEYNPRWILKFKYEDDRLFMEDKLNRLLKKHIMELERIKPILISNKDKYIEELEDEN
jgi:hypothetical protein